ncbi:MAG: endonuclease/exonuclease/phosphatase (EEP) superfamily protein YafD [Limisphaerales bacterium]
MNQIGYLAEKTVMHCWAFDEYYNVGLPFYIAPDNWRFREQRVLPGIASDHLAVVATFTLQ